MTNLRVKRALEGWKCGGDRPVKPFAVCRGALFFCWKMAPGSPNMSGNTCGEEYYEHVSRLSWSHGSILWVIMCCISWHPIPSHQLWEPLYSKDKVETFTTGLPHTCTIVITVDITSRFFAEDDLILFNCNPISLNATPFQIEARVSRCQWQNM